MLITYNRKRGTPLTPEQIAEIEAAKSFPIVFDEDSPELTPEAIERFRRSAHERNQRLKKMKEQGTA